MNKFILEIGTEEIPAVYIDNILKNMKSNAENILNQYHIDFNNIQTFSTPRRLIVYIEDIADRQKDISQKIKGPSVTVAFDKDGKSTKTCP
jgi:glycyl-tRNA synthetase beta chain